VVGRDLETGHEALTRQSLTSIEAVGAGIAKILPASSRPAKAPT
jgi:hypothetical protein